MPGPGFFGLVGLGFLINHLIQREVNNTDLTNILNDVRTGSITAGDAQGLIAVKGYNPGGSHADFLQTKLSEEAAAKKTQQELSARDSSLISTANQLTQLGLNPASAINLGGSSAGISAGQASPSTSYGVQNTLNQYNQRLALARSLIKTSGALASAGIHGGALIKSRSIASLASNSASNAAYSVLRAQVMNNHKSRPNNKNVNDDEWNDMMSYFNE